jgi:DNA-binding transcriptional LysR family regulator
MAVKYPQIDVFLVRAVARELYAKVLDGDLDAAVTLQPPFSIPKAHDWRVLWEEPFIVLTPASLRVRNPHVILASEPFIRLHRAAWTGQIVDHYLRHACIRPAAFQKTEIEKWWPIIKAANIKPE